MNPPWDWQEKPLGDYQVSGNESVFVLYDGYLFGEIQRARYSLGEAETTRFSSFVNK